MVLFLAANGKEQFRFCPGTANHGGDMVNVFFQKETEWTPAERLRRANSLSASFLREKFPGVDSAEFFLQFGPGFDTVGLFDSEPLCLPMYQLPGMPLQPTPDQVQPSFSLASAAEFPCWFPRGTVILAGGLYPCILPLTAAWHLGIRKHLFIDNGISLIPEINWQLDTDDGFPQRICLFPAGWLA